MNLNEGFNLLIHVVNGGVQRGLFEKADDVGQVLEAIKVVKIAVDQMHGLQEQLDIANNNGIRLLKENEALAESITDLQRQLQELQKA